MPQQFLVCRDKCQGLVAFTGIGAEVFGKLVRHVHKGIRIGWCRLLPRDVGPNLRVLAVEVEPFFEPWLNVRLDGIDWAFRDALIQDE